MPYTDIPAFMKELATASPTTGRDALRFTIYNAVRSSETREAVWTEIDLDKAVWTIPGERMKAKETHVVPLSKAAVSILRRRWKLRTSDDGLRSEERRVGKEWVSTCRSRWSLKT